MLRGEHVKIYIEIIQVVSGIDHYRSHKTQYANEQAESLSDKYFPIFTLTYTTFCSEECWSADCCKFASFLKELRFSRLFITPSSHFVGVMGLGSIGPWE